MGRKVGMDAMCRSACFCAAPLNDIRTKVTASALVSIFDLSGVAVLQLGTSCQPKLEPAKTPSRLHECNQVLLDLLSLSSGLHRPAVVPLCLGSAVKPEIMDHM